MAREFVNLSLNRFLGSAKPLPAVEAVSILIDLLYELEQDHNKGLIHGGVYPDQVVLDTKGGPRLLKLTEGRNLDELTPAFLCFVPPERLQGEAISIQTDLFSMGVVLFVLLTGYLPFDAKNKEVLLAEVRSAKVKDLPLFPGSHEIDWMIRKCLVDVPNRRFASASEMVGSLKKWMVSFGLKPKVSATRPAQQIERWIRTAARKKLVSRKAINLIALLMLVTVGGLAYFLFPSKKKPGDFARWQEVPLPSESYLEQDPTLSPDGSQVAFVSDRAANWELYVKNKKEVEPFRLSRSPGFESDPRWSPKGDLILYGYVEPETAPALYAVSPAGGVPQRLAINAIDGQWSPDAKSVCYITPVTEKTASVVVLDLLGKEPKTILKNIAGLRHPSFSPDGETIVCEMDVRPAHGLVLVELNSGKQKILTKEFWDNSPSWNWKTGLIYFSSKRGGAQKIYRTDTSGNVEIVTRGPGNDYRPAPSLKGDQIVFYRQQIRSDIFVMDPAGGIPRNISPIPGSSSYPVGFPDSDTLFYLQAKEKGFKLARRQDLFAAPSTVLEDVGDAPAAAISSKGTLILEHGGDLWEIHEPGQHKLLDRDQLLPLMTSPDSRLKFISRRKTDFVSYSLKDLKTGDVQDLFSLPAAARIKRAAWLPDHSILYTSRGALYQWSFKEKSSSILLPECHDFAYKPGTSIAILQGPNKEASKLELFDLRTKNRRTIVNFPSGEYGRHIDWCLRQRFICYDRLQPGSDLFLLEGANTTKP